MILAEAITVILTTVGWPVSALMSKFVSELWENTRRKLSQRREIKSLRAEQENSVGKKNVLKNLKKLKRDVSEVVDLLKQLELIKHRVELRISICAEHGEVIETCPTSSKASAGTTPQANSSEACGLCWALDKIRTQLVLGFAVAGELTAASELLDQIMERGDELGAPSPRARLRQPTAHNLKGEEIGFGWLSQYQDQGTVLEPTSRDNKSLSQPTRRLTKATDPRPEWLHDPQLRLGQTNVNHNQTRTAESEFFGEKTARSAPDYLKLDRTQAAQPQFFCGRTKKSDHHCAKLEQTHTEEPQPQYFSAKTPKSDHDYIKLKRDRTAESRCFYEKTQSSDHDYINVERVHAVKPQFLCEDTKMSDHNDIKLERTHTVKPQFICESTKRSNHDEVTHAVKPQFFWERATRSDHDYMKLVGQTRAAERGFLKHRTLLKRTSTESEGRSARQRSVQTEPSAGLDINFILFNFSFLCSLLFYLSFGDLRKLSYYSLIF